MAGNNLSFSEELMRRICPIRMDANVPDPAQDRPLEQFKYQDIRAWTAENRPRLVQCCHILIRSWIAKGKPKGRANLQSFTEWAQTMSGIFEAAGVHGFMETFPAYSAVKGAEKTSAAALFEHLFETFKNDPFVTRDAYEAGCNPCGGTGLEKFSGPSWKFDEEVPLVGKDDHARISSLGHYLKKAEGKTFKLSSGDLIKLVPLPGRKKTYQLKSM